MVDTDGAVLQSETPMAYPFQLPFADDVPHLLAQYTIVASILLSIAPIQPYSIPIFRVHANGVASFCIGIKGKDPLVVLTSLYNHRQYSWVLHPRCSSWIMCIVMIDCYRVRAVPNTYWFPFLRIPNPKP